MELIELKRFREVNHLGQSEVAEYLGVSRAQVSMIERGKSRLTNENLRKLITNPYGWDVSMLPKDPMATVTGVVINGSNEIKNSTIDNRHYYSDSPDVLRAQIDILEERIKEKDAQIKRLLDILQGMKK